MNELLAQLVILQAIDKEIDQIDQAIKAEQSGLDERISALAKRETFINELQENIEMQQRESRTLEGEMADKMDHVRDRQSKMMQVQTGREQTALLKEIEDAKKYALGRHQMGIQTVGQLNNWLSNRYFFDGRLEDFSARPERIKAITRERIIDTARDFFAANCWGLGLYGNTEKAVAERLNEKLEKLF